MNMTPERRLEAERDAAVAEAAALRDVLTELQMTNDLSCPSCGACLGEHDEGCKLAAALSRPGPGAALLTRLRAMEKLLRRLEWAGDTSGTECVCCYATKANGHAPGCELAALLSAAPPAGEGGGT